MSWLDEAVATMIGHTNPALLYESKRLGLQLEQFRNFDFRSMDAELAAVFENPKGIHLRHNGLSHRVSLDGAGQYVDTPMITYLGVSERDAQLLADMRKALDVNMRLLDAEQAGVLQQAYVLAILPDRTGRPRLHRFLPYEVAEVVITDPWADDDLSAADRVVLMKPITPPGNAGLLANLDGVSPWCAKIVLTRTEAYMEMPDGTKAGIYEPGGSNPLGRIPVVGTRRAKPANGVGYFPEVARDVLSCHIGLTLVISDCEFIARYETPTKIIATGPGAKTIPKTIPSTPMRIIPFGGDQADVTVTEIQSQAPIEKYIRAAETAVYYLSQYRYLRPEAYQASIVTGSARRADAEGFMEDRRRHETRTAKLEQDLCDLMVATWNAGNRALKIQGNPEVKALYRYVRAQDNVLQEAQALEKLFGLGLLDEVREVSHREGVSLEMAAARLAERQARQLALLKARAEAMLPATPEGDAPEVGDRKVDEGEAEAEPAGPPAPEGDVAKTALNGAQIASLKSIVEGVTAGLLDVESSLEMVALSFPDFDLVSVRRMLEKAAGFTPKTPPTPEAPTAAP